MDTSVLENSGYAVRGYAGDIEQTTDSIKESVLKFTQAKCIYLFGSYAYGTPNEGSDIDIYVVTPDDAGNLLQLCAKIRGDLTDKKIFLIDLLLGSESVFNDRKEKHVFERTIYQKGRVIYEQ
jgi:predicted nucleotidyltransferase